MPETELVVLVVEDGDRLAGILRRTLERTGHHVDIAPTGERALHLAIHDGYDVIILDVGLPGIDGFEVCRRLRAAETQARILMLTARADIADRVRGLDAGADDYLAKPFSVSELLARVRALVRRGGGRSSVLKAGAIRVEPSKQRVTVDGELVELTVKEFALLELFVRNAGAVLTRDAIREHVWPGHDPRASNVVDVYVRYLRDKIDRPFGRGALQTVRGAGYRLRSV